MIPIKTYKKFETIVLYFVKKKNLERSFQNGPEHETTSLNMFYGTLKKGENAVFVKKSNCLSEQN